MKYLYKYPAVEYPYKQLIEQNRQRSRSELEFELIDTGVFDRDRYCDVFVEYAKEAPNDILVRISVHNRGSEPAVIHLLPTLFFRNVWSWASETRRPVLRKLAYVGSASVIAAECAEPGEMFLYCEGNPPLLFTENDTNTERIFGVANQCPYVKDGINNYVVKGESGVINPACVGTKAAAHFVLSIDPHANRVVRLRLTDIGPEESAKKYGSGAFGEHVDRVFDARLKEADAFYASISPARFTADEAAVYRQALAGMLWTKQFYHYDVDKWLEERGSDPFKPTRKEAPRNDHWHHMYNGDIISMPDKWEYPWYAAWDLAFHVLALSLVDPDFSKQQLRLMLRERYMHPNGQIPAYEWNFGDVNPPVHAWSTIFTYRLEKGRTGVGDRDWLKSSFQKLLLNFTWWVNRKDRWGRNVFEGGFLGLDNIGVFDRSAPLPTGGYLEQADGTAWMALYCQNMLEIASELAMTDADYGDMALKFCEHFLWIASAMFHVGSGTGMWDEDDGFFYDVLRLPDGSSQRLNVRSMVGLLPLCAATAYDGELLSKNPELGERFRWFLLSRPEIHASIHDPMKLGVAGRHLGSILNETKLRRVLARMLDENEFLSPFGIRSLSRYHADHPYTIQAGGRDYRVAYLPAESDTGMFGGNSNWRGPIWMPVNVLIVRALIQYYLFYGDQLKVECPTGSGRWMNLYEVAEDISRRLASIFLKGPTGSRPVFGGSEKFQTDPHWRDYPLFYEYFHGENGAGLGASHQTGWTGVVARTMHLFASWSSSEAQRGGRITYAEASNRPVERSDYAAEAQP
jgi:hypothetical protein